MKIWEIGVVGRASYYIFRKYCSMHRSRVLYLRTISTRLASDLMDPPPVLITPLNGRWSVDAPDRGPVEIVRSTGGGDYS